MTKFFFSKFEVFIASLSGLISWMVTLSSSLIWQIISFNLPLNECGLCIRLKNHLFRWSSFWSWRVSKQAKLSNKRSDVRTRDQQWIVPLLISTHDILSISESTVFKFKYFDLFVLITTLFHTYRLHWLWVQCWHQTHNNRNMFDS